MERIVQFSSNSLALVLSSTYFDVADYIDNYNVYQRKTYRKDWNDSEIINRIVKAQEYDAHKTSVLIVPY